MRIILPLLTCLLAFSTLAEGAIIKFIKKRKIVVLDDGDVNKRDKVCFFAGSKKRACGRVVKVKKDKSYVKIKKKKHFRRIKKDMNYEISSADGSSRSSGGGGLKLRVLWTPSLFARSSFNYIEWKDGNKDEDDEDDNTEDNTDNKFAAIEKSKLEEAEKNIDSSFERLNAKLARYFPWLSFGFEGELAVSDSLSIVMGGRYTHLETYFSKEVDFNFKHAGTTEPFMRSTYGGYEISGWLDCLCLEVSEIKLGAGVGYSYSKVELTTKKAERESKEEDAKIAEVEGKDFVYFSGSSSANIMSFRLSVRKDFPMGGHGLGLGLTAIISPFTLTDSEFIKDGDVHKELLDEYGTGDDDERTDKVLDDISEALGHQHNIFSLMLSVSLFLGI